MDGSLGPIVHFNGEGVERQKRAFQAACVDEKLRAPVVPHTLRHTAITWLMQAGGTDRGSFGLRRLFDGGIAAHRLAPFPRISGQRRRDQDG